MSNIEYRISNVEVDSTFPASQLQTERFTETPDFDIRHSTFDIRYSFWEFCSWLSIFDIFFVFAVCHFAVP